MKFTMGGELRLNITVNILTTTQRRTSNIIGPFERATSVRDVEF